MVRWGSAFVVALVVIVGFSGSAAGAVVNPQIDAYSSNPLVTPGTSTSLSVQFVNDAVDPDNTARTARQVRVTMTGGDAPINVKSGTSVLGDLADGQSRTVDFQLVVPRDAQPGTYQVPIRLQYEFGSRVVTETVYVSIQVESVARFDLAASGTSVSIGDTGTLSLSLQNIGSEAATEARVVVESAAGDLTLGGGSGSSDAFVGEWAANATRDVEFKIGFAGDAIQRNYPLSVRVEYRDDDGRTRTDSLAAGIRPEPKQSFRITELRSAAPVGGSGQLELALRNTGPATVYGSTVTVTFLDADLSFPGNAVSAQSFVGSWEPRSVKRFSYRLDVSDRAVTRNYSVRTTVEYEDEAGNARTPRTSLGAIRPAPEQTFAVKNFTSDLAIGATGVIEGEIVNTGSSSVSDAVVVLDAEGTNLAPQAVEYPVGALEPGAASPVRFTIDVPDSASPNVRRFAFVVRYENDVGEIHRSDPLGVRANVTARQPRFLLTPIDTRFTVDSAGRLEFTLRNDRSGVVTDVSVGLSVVDPLKSDDATAFVETLDSGATAPIGFHLEVTDDAIPGTHPITVDISYRDAAGTLRESGPYRVGIHVAPEEAVDSSFIPIAVAGAVLVVGLLWWFRRH